MTEIYLVRHAEATGNSEGVFQGSIDRDLSQKGYAQAQWVAKGFGDIKIDKVYSSPLLRARMTAQAIAHGKNLSVIVYEDLREINGGGFEGMRFADLPVIYPEESYLWRNKPHEFIAPEGESMVSVRDRGIAALTYIAKQNTGQSIAVVSHGAVIRSTLGQIIYKDFSKLCEMPWCDNTGVTKLIYSDNGFEVVYLNDTTHLQNL